MIADILGEEIFLRKPIASIPGTLVISVKLTSVGSEFWRGSMLIVSERGDRERRSWALYYKGEEGKGSWHISGNSNRVGTLTGLIDIPNSADYPFSTNPLFNIGICNIISEWLMGERAISDPKPHLPRGEKKLDLRAMTTTAKTPTAKTGPEFPRVSPKDNFKLATQVIKILCEVCNVNRDDFETNTRVEPWVSIRRGAVYILWIRFHQGRKVVMSVLSMIEGSLIQIADNGWKYILSDEPLIEQLNRTLAEFGQQPITPDELRNMRGQAQ